MSVHAPESESSEEEKGHFWKELNECLMRFAPYNRVVVVGYMNARVADKSIERCMDPGESLG